MVTDLSVKFKHTGTMWCLGALEGQPGPERVDLWGGGGNLAGGVRGFADGFDHILLGLHLFGLRRGGCAGGLGLARPVGLG